MSRRIYESFKNYFSLSDYTDSKKDFTDFRDFSTFSEIP